MSVEVQEEMREAANNLVKHFHKPEQEVCECYSGCALQIQPLHSFNLLVQTVSYFLQDQQREKQSEIFM